MLAGKKILIAVTGSIAAYKAAFFVRLLVKSGAKVKVMLTPDAHAFVTPLTLATVSKNEVLSAFFNEKTGEWTNHVELALWADLLIISPASANTLAKMAHGICDNLVLATYLSAKCPVMIAPAMDLDMYKHPSTVKNLQTLTSFGHQIVDAEEGELASGLHGAGRMAEPETLVTAIETHFQKSALLSGKKVLITSGPTHEPIDAVRFIGNHSSGKMGSALADSFTRQGASVVYVTGPAHVEPKSNNIKIHRVKTAVEMDVIVSKEHPSCEIAIFTAAVADFRPEKAQTTKRKKEEGGFTIKLVENPDIALNAGKQKKAQQFHVGFALETHNEKDFALRKLQQKNFDLIVLNSLNDEGAGFAHDSNKVTVYDKDNNAYPFELKPKEAVADDIVQIILQKI